MPDDLNASLSEDLWFSSRQLHRYALTDFYYGSKAYDPFNTALNAALNFAEKGPIPA